MDKVQGIVLAAGKSTRFKTGKTKLIEKICGQEMILFITKLLGHFNIPTSVVVGYQKEVIEQVINQAHPNTVQFVTQQEQKGTGHALICTQEHWNKDHLLILNGDMPLVDEHIIQELYDTHKNANADITFVTAHISEIQHSYGRVVQHGTKIEIIEAKDFTGDPLENCCINAGIYLAKRSFIESSISQLNQNNNSNEFYITDLIKIASEKNCIVKTISAPFDMVRGVNTLQELWAAEQIKRSQIIKEWMDKGVRFSVAQNVHIDLDVIIGPGSYIGCGAHILKGSVIGKNCTIHENVSIENTRVGENVTIFPYCIIIDSTIGDNASIGPFAHVHHNAHIGQGAVIGNFVEVKETVLGSESKAKHLAYLGNSIIGSHVNIGAGTITCNYDGVSKNKTIIDDHAFVGSNNTLVAPLHIGKHAFTAAGSVITHDVPEKALALGRSRQVNKENYAHKLRDARAEIELSQEEDLRFSGALKTNNDSSSLDNL